MPNKTQYKFFLNVHSSYSSGGTDVIPYIDFNKYAKNTLFLC